jgi:phage terminase Nu1 subunit (DNA packaging protein)
MAALLRREPRELSEWRRLGCPVEVGEDDDEAWDLAAVRDWLRAGGLRGKRAGAGRGAALAAAIRDEGAAGAAVTSVPADVAERIAAARSLEELAAANNLIAREMVAGRVAPNLGRALRDVLAEQRRAANDAAKAPEGGEAPNVALVSEEGAAVAALVDSIANGRRREAVLAFARAQIDADAAERPRGDAPAGEHQEALARLRLDAFGEPLEGREPVRARLAGAALGAWDVGEAV